MVTAQNTLASSIGTVASSATCANVTNALTINNAFRMFAGYAPQMIDMSQVNVLAHQRAQIERGCNNNR